MATRHSQHTHVYHTDLRTGFAEPLSEMRWQNGILTKQTDTAIVGSRDIAVARAVAVNRHEFEIDKKLSEPVDRKSDEDEILI